MDVPVAADVYAVIEPQLDEAESQLPFIAMRAVFVLTLRMRTVCCSEWAR